jgi:hydroxymethylpyrimidine pyrophosphatase-like HAD family hydrolase
MIIAVDFDGTIVTHEYPEIGGDIPGALLTLREWIMKGHQIILWTMRSGEELEAAVQYLEENDIELWGINENPDQIESGWSTSNKQYAHKYVDDAAIGCPLIYPLSGARPYVDWQKIDL